MDSIITAAQKFKAFLFHRFGRNNAVEYMEVPTVAGGIFTFDSNLDPLITTSPTVADAPEVDRTTLAVNSRWVQALLLSGSIWSPPIAAYAATLVGTGASADVDGSGVLELQTGATAASTAKAYAGNGALFNRGGAATGLNFSKRVIFKARLLVNAASTNGIIRATVGKVAADGVGALARKAFGFKVANLALKGICHNGTTETEVNLATALVANTVYDLMAVNDGAGTITWYVNGTSVGTSALGPTGSGSGATQFEVDNGADAANVAVTFRPAILIAVQ